MHQIELHGHINTTSQINNKHFTAITKKHVSRHPQTRTSEFCAKKFNCLASLCCDQRIWIRAGVSNSSQHVGHGGR